MGLFDKLFGSIKKNLDSLADETPIEELFEEPVQEPIKSPNFTLIDDKFKQEKKIEDHKKVMLLETELVLNKMFNEIKIYPFKDKYRKYINLSNLPELEYLFEDKTTAKFIFVNDSKFEILFKDTKYKNYIITSKRLYKILNEISNFCETCRERITNAPVIEPVIESKYKNLDPSLKEKYNLIVRQIKLRQEELNKIDKNDKKRLPLENELTAYKKAADRIKSQFK
jgi:hypothetical protein